MGRETWTRHFGGFHLCFEVPIPADRGAYSRFAELDDNNHFVLRDILNQISANDPKRDANDTKVGDYHASCVDEAAIDKKGLAPT